MADKTSLALFSVCVDTFPSTPLEFMFLSALSFVFGHALPSRAEDQLMPVDAEMRGHVWIEKASGFSHNIWSQVKDLKGREGTPEGRKDLGRSPVLPLKSCLGKEGSGDV